jgi:hypothetical protein
MKRPLAVEEDSGVAVEDVDVVAVGVLVVGIIGLPVQVVGLEVPRDMAVVDLLMEVEEAMVVVAAVVGMVEVEVIRLVEVVSKGGGNCANTFMQPPASTGHKKRIKPLKKLILTSPPSRLYPAFLVSSFPLPIVNLDRRSSSQPFLSPTSTDLDFTTYALQTALNEAQPHFHTRPHFHFHLVSTLFLLVPRKHGTEEPLYEKNCGIRRQPPIGG